MESLYSPFFLIHRVGLCVNDSFARGGFLLDNVCCFDLDRAAASAIRGRTIRRIGKAGTSSSPFRIGQRSNAYWIILLAFIFANAFPVAGETQEKKKGSRKKRSHLNMWHY